MPLLYDYHRLFEGGIHMEPTNKLGLPKLILKPTKQELWYYLLIPLSLFILRDIITYFAQKDSVDLWWQLISDVVIVVIFYITLRIKDWLSN